MKTNFIDQVRHYLLFRCLFPALAMAGSNASDKHALQINEIMTSSKADRGLPKYEYIEIFNPSENAIELSEWTITIGKYSRTIPNYHLEARDYVILTTVKGADSLAPYSMNKVLGIKSFPAILHGGATVLLKDPAGRLISALTYKNTWFGKSEKAKGGWSLEQVDCNNTCGGESNWKPTKDPGGGTPGRINSVNDINTDNSLSDIKRITVLDSKTLRLYFSKSLDTSTFFPNSFTINNFPNRVVSVTAVAPDFTTLDLGFEKPFEYKQKYALSINGNLLDCSGNPIPSNIPRHFGLPESCAPSDIIINEILFDPNTGGTYFVELKNRSNKFIELKGISLVKADPLLYSHESTTDLTDEGYILFPGDYLVLTGKSASVLHEYPMSQMNRFLHVAKFPALNRTHGEILLLNKEEEIIDSLIYSKAMHFSLLKSTKGVSLERMDSERPAQDSGNWHSAAEQSGFATPGYKNSEDLHTGGSSDLIYLETEIFSPDQDGYQDVLPISFHAPAAAGTFSILLFDASGQLVRQLVKNELAASQAMYTWDGINEQHEKAAIGAYLIYAAFFDSTTGKTSIQKLRCVLAGKLN